MSGPARLAGKRIIITGAAGGLGREFALHLAALGARVLAADIADVSETCALARERGVTEILPVVVDVRSADQTRALAQTATDALGGVDALVNNAAIVAGLTRTPFEDIPEEEWDRVLEVNLKGCWLCTRAITPLLRAGGGGSIVNLASEVAYSGSPGLAHYVASKAGIVGLTRVLARELGPAQIRVNALAPGFIPTEASVGMLGGDPYDVSRTPLGRLAQPDDLLGTLAFLVSDESAFVTGQTLLVNGGRVFA